MTYAVHLALIFGALVSARAQAPMSRLDRPFMFGAEYVRLEDWARANGGSHKWTVPKHQAQAVVPGGTLLVEIDSRKVSVKGIHVWLSVPVVMRGNSAYLAAADFIGTIQPLLFPAKAATGRPIKTIVLDPGHGGKDPGNIEGKKQEKLYTLQLARDVRALLTKAGFKVHLTRDSDSLLDLETRPTIAQQRTADVFVSLHFNSADGPGAASVKGSEVYCLTPAHAHSTNDRGERGRTTTLAGNRCDTRNVQLAYLMQKSIVDTAGSDDRGVKRARFVVLKNAEMPAVLIEAAFMTNAGDARRIYNPVERRSLARAVADGITAYKRLVER
ncbi:MAG: N-acetylmuramoyl-L-alanine amidase [Verrucomicrobiota bacterium]|jgi:N-acetylmuramoyl-L-alanine amidase